jgi:hypothetical protein
VSCGLRQGSECPSRCARSLRRSLGESWLGCPSRGCYVARMRGSLIMFFFLSLLPHAPIIIHTGAPFHTQEEAAI